VPSEKGSKGNDFSLVLSSRYSLDALRHTETELVSLGFTDPRMVMINPVGSVLHRQLIAAIEQRKPA
jgi:DNA polymerase III sliding clamp (beta) subunit (PCNA family)